MTTPVRSAAANELRRPLQPGEPICYWQLSGITEQRYDVADIPMGGEMDPFFFLAKEKNFIPHQYPCRTQFAAERRGQRPRVGNAFEPQRYWFPFGSPRVDLSGFWFRATVISAAARTSLVAESAGQARLRLATCGGAVLRVNGEEVGWLAPYTRNLEASADFEVELRAGHNELIVHFDDLAERDARFSFELTYLDGPPASVALATGIPGETASTIEALLDGMTFDRPFYTEGEVRLLFPVPMPATAQATITIAGDGLGAGHFDVHRALPAGATSLSLGPSEELPADFRHHTLAIDIDGFRTARTLGVEICHVAEQGVAPATPQARIEEALRYVAQHSEADTIRALACLATGAPGADEMIARMLPSIEDCYDCADFMLVPLLWIRRRFWDSVEPALRDRVDRAILNYRYWTDEPGNDVQWYFSENHALLFHTAAYIGGDMLPDATFVRSRRSGREQSAVGAARVRAWLDHFELWEMAEFNSAPYFPIDLKGLCALAALAPDADIRERAARGISRLLEIVARSAHHGMITAAQGRSYEHSLRPVRTLELSSISRLCWGRGWYGCKVHSLPLLALLVRDHGYSPPAGLAAVADHNGDEHLEWCFAQGPQRIARLYHYKARDYAMGSVAAYRWNAWGYQETPLHLRLGQVPEAQVWINHPGETIQFGFGRPSFWGGNGTLPRVHQYRGLAVLLFDVHEGQPDFTHAWFPTVAFDEHQVDGSIALARGGDGMVLLKGAAPLELADSGPSAGVELRQPGRKGMWIVRVADCAEAATLGEMRARFGGLECDAHSGAMLVISDPQYGPVHFRADGVIEAEGRRLDPSEWTIGGHTSVLDA